MSDATPRETELAHTLVTKHRQLLDFLATWANAPDTDGLHVAHLAAVLVREGAVLAAVGAFSVPEGHEDEAAIHAVRTCFETFNQTFELHLAALNKDEEALATRKLARAR